MFQLTVDASRKMIISHFEGFLSPEEVLAWHAQEQSAAADLGCGSREFILYVDTSKCAIQSQEVVALFQRLIASSPLKARRIAIMQGSSLTKMQTRRVVAAANHVGHFGERAEAVRWLMEKPIHEAATLRVA